VPFHCRIVQGRTIRRRRARTEADVRDFTMIEVAETKWKKALADRPA
jgi:hypothetical protein